MTTYSEDKNMFYVLSSSLSEIEEAIRTNNAPVEENALTDLFFHCKVAFQSIIASCRSTLKHEIKAPLEQIFPDFPTELMKRVFNMKQENAMKILPYHMAAVYILMMYDCSFPDESTDQLLFDKYIRKDSNYQQNVRNLASRFSLFSYKQSLFAFSRRDSGGKTIQSEATLREQLSNPTLKKLTPLHAAMIVQAFVYCQFAHLCTLYPEISHLVDYKVSFRLFNIHMMAFQTRYIVPYDSYPVDTGIIFDDKASLADQIAKIWALYDYYGLISDEDWARLKDADIMKDLDTVIKCDDSDEADSDYDLSKEEYTNKHTVDLSFSSIQLDPQFEEMFPDWDKYYHPISSVSMESAESDRNLSKKEMDSLEESGLTKLQPPPITEEELYRSLPGILLTLLHPLNEEYYLWPSVFPTHFQSGQWSKRDNQFKPNIVMDWAKIRTWLRRRLSVPQSQS